MATGLAALLPGEEDMLAAVVASPADDTAKLVYADWLEEHDDPRGSFLRQFVQAVREDQRLPDFAAFPLGWQHIVGVHLIDRVRELGLSEHRTAILARAKPSVAVFTKLAREEEIPSDGSKFGGLPSLPVGMPWPRCESGPMEFLAQLDLAELSQTVAGRVLPSHGLLSFFMFHDCYDDEYGASSVVPKHPFRGLRGVAGGLRVIYTPQGTDRGFRKPPKDLTERLGKPRQPCRPSFLDALDIPDSDPSWPQFEESLRLPVFNDADHQLFGYSHRTVLCEDPTPRPDWDQLIRFSSDYKVLKWNWGDLHRLFWYIRSDDLRAGRFDDTVAIDG